MEGDYGVTVVVDHASGGRLNTASAVAAEPLLAISTAPCTTSWSAVLMYSSRPTF